MGSFNVSCNLTQDTIGSGDQVVVVMLTQNNSYNRMPCYSWDLWSPIPIMIEGTYNSYGAIENYSIYQSQDTFNDKELKKIRKHLVNFMKNNGVTDIDDQLSSELAFERLDSKSQMVESMLGMAKIGSENPDFQKQIMQMLKGAGMDSLKEAKEYVKNNKGTTVNIPIQLVFFKKDALTKLLNTFGQYNNDEHYVPKLQKMRQGEYTQKELADAVGFISGTTRFAGNNRPLFNWNNISESMAKTSKADTAALNKINEMHCVDLSLVNDFFSLLGKTWTPSMYMSEFAREYGQIEALQMLQELTKKDSLKKTKNKP